MWLEPCIVSSINCRSSSEWCAIRGVCIENGTVNVPSQPICSRKSKITPIKKLLEWAETSGSCQNTFTLLFRQPAESVLWFFAVCCSLKWN